ncbi:MAG: hypothetical protein JW818_09585 [Pirellulales bacterium]|nr:hypothetical protein [Pirellulales bacterium]
MIGRLLKTLGTGLIILCIGTIISEVVMFMIIRAKWQLNDKKWEQMLAIAQGYDLIALRDEAEQRKTAIATEEPSFVEIIEARAMKNRNLELREQELVQAQENFRHQQQVQTDQRRQFDRDRTTFEEKLAKIENETKSTGFQDNIVILQNLPPDQAKLQLLQMYDNDEIDAVVQLMAGMSPSKRKKINAEFQTPEENEKLGEILRRIRQGYPTATLASETKNLLQQPPAAQP